MKASPKTSLGFSLVELSIVLVIVGLVIAGMLVPLSAQIDQKNYNETQKAMIEMRDGLIGYASSNGYLPCPDTTGDGMEERDASGACLAIEGNIPWANLGMGRNDAWGRNYQYRVMPTFSNSATRFALSSASENVTVSCSAGSASLMIVICDTNATLLATRVPAVIVSKGKNGSGAGTNEQQNSDKLDNLFISDVPSAVAGNEFDDIVVWVPSTLLFSRMISAGKLP